MKNIVLVLVASIFINSIDAQLTITAGAQFVLSGNAQLTLSNMDFVNSGVFSAGTGSVLFTGNAVNIITGSQNMTLYDLNIGKTAGSVQLQVPIAVSHQVIFTTGLLDLNANDLNLGSTGSLNGEQESTHIIGSNGGRVVANAALNAPTGANPGNLGAIITSSQNLGNVVIGRGHQSQVNGSGAGNSILRYYDISPDNNSGLNATLRFNYLNAELNGLDENGLVDWEKQNTASWTSLGFDARNTTSNYVDKNAISSFGRLTLSSINNALPVRFISFTAYCNGNAVQLAWKTAQEQNSHYYLVEKSADGIVWNTVGNVAAAGNSTVESDYVFADNNAIGNDYYRIAEYDLDGNTIFTNTVRAGCTSQAALRIWPNPASDILYVYIPSSSGANATIKLFDGKGALVKQQSASLVNGNNLISLDVKRLAAGLYYLSIMNATGEVQTQKIMKE